VLLDGNKIKEVFLILLPDGNVLLALKFNKVINPGFTLCFIIIIVNIIQLIHEDM